MHRFEFYTFDKILGVEKTRLATTNLLTAITAIDKANEDLATELKKTQNELEKLRRKYEKVKSR